MEKKRIDTIKKWLKSKSIQDIQIFIGFTNFYWCFIKGISRIVASLTAMLKTIGSFVASISKVDDNRVVVGGGAIDGGAVIWSDMSRKSAKSKS